MFWGSALALAFMLSPAVPPQTIPQIDYEESIQDFVIETTRIVVPEFPHAFNPSIIRWKEKLLMTFRVIPDPKNSYISYIGYVWLNDDFQPISEARLFNLRRDDPAAPSRAEDARLITVSDRLYMVYSDNPNIVITGGGFRVYIAELTTDGELAEVILNERITAFDGECPTLREKSWVPFSYNDNLLLAYSLSPHKIFLPILGENSCETIALSDNPFEWAWGIIRGGTPAFPIDDTHYLSFYHSSIRTTSVHSDGKNIMHYFIGAYLFSNNPPFEITHRSPEPIVGPNFYYGETYKHYWKPVKAVFPCGYIMDDAHIWMAYGRDDHEMWIVKIDKTGLLQSLIECSNCSTGFSL